MLVDDDPGITKELELMKKLRKQMQITCVTAVINKIELGLSEEQEWLRKINQHKEVNKKIICALRKSIEEKQRKMQIMNKLQQIKS